MRWRLDLPTLAALSKYWRKYPPLQVMIAAYLGIKSDEPDKVKKPAFEELMAEFPPVPYSPPHINRLNNND